MSLRIGKLLGVPVKLHYTLILGILLIAWTLAVGYLPLQYPELSSATYWLIGSIGAIVLFASVLIHELAHSYIAKKSHLPVRRIILFIFGGVSEIEEEPKEASVEFKIALAGATLYEREMHDLFSVNFEGHPNLEPLILPHDWPKDVYPLRKSGTTKEGKLKKKQKHSRTNI